MQKIKGKQLKARLNKVESVYSIVLQAWTKFPQAFFPLY
jgi:hypothetical protein